MIDKEKIYDEKINPLMTQIVNICKEYGIAMLASFSVPSKDDEDLICLTVIPDEKNKNGIGHLTALRILKNEVPNVDFKIEDDLINIGSVLN